ncbi:hypothetical protein RRG08_058414 [Elysia crispata]|uniref:Uncharacterized protein n=1 Tax=Elysia crispata TaxID=231223 RepID=A0AAE1CNM6_9GAST|nr:hypothetical protein RRG08_058414 [Elysia crispata]
MLGKWKLSRAIESTGYSLYYKDVSNADIFYVTSQESSEAYYPKNDRKVADYTWRKQGPADIKQNDVDKNPEILLTIILITIVSIRLVNWRSAPPETGKECTRSDTVTQGLILLYKASIRLTEACVMLL